MAPDLNKTERGMHATARTITNSDHRGKLLTIVIEDVTITGRLNHVTQETITERTITGPDKPIPAGTSITLGDGFNFFIHNPNTIVTIHD